MGEHMPHIKLKSLLRENQPTLSLREKKALLEDLRAMRQSLQFESDVSGEEAETIVSNVPMTGDIDDNNIVRIEGVVQKALPLDQLEKQSVINYVKAKPTPPKATNPHVIRYNHMADRNNMVTVIQKMQEGSEFKYVAFQRIITSAGADGQLESPLGAKLKVITTRTFADGQTGSNVLSDFLKLLNV
jgi:hypothetical protein